MKIAPRFSLKLNFFDFTSLRQGQFLQMTEKTKDFKSIEQGHTEGTFPLPWKIPTLGLYGGKPQTPKSKSKGKMVLRFARVFSKAKAHDS